MSIFTPDNLAQMINPWTWFTKASDNMNGFININNYKSSNPNTEHAIVHEVAGYGMQLDAIENILTILLDKIPNKNFTEHQKKAIGEFNSLIKDIADKKEQIALDQLSAGGIDKLINNLQVMKEKYPERYEKIATQLKKSL